MGNNEVVMTNRGRWVINGEQVRGRGEGGKEGGRALSEWLVEEGRQAQEAKKVIK